MHGQTGQQTWRPSNLATDFQLAPTDDDFFLPGATGHAALMAISAISEGCRDLMIGELDKVLDLVLPALRDPHPRVRWAGLQCSWANEH